MPAQPLGGPGSNTGSGVTTLAWAQTLLPVRNCLQQLPLQSSQAQNNAALSCSSTEKTTRGCSGPDPEPLPGLGAATGTALRASALRKGGRQQRAVIYRLGVLQGHQPVKHPRFCEQHAQHLFHLPSPDQQGRLMDRASFWGYSTGQTSPSCGLFLLLDD